MFIIDKISYCENYKNEFTCWFYIEYRLKNENTININVLKSNRSILKYLF